MELSRALNCFHKRHTGAEIIFRTQFHHAVVTDLRMVLTKQDLDEAFREKRFSDNTKVELIFEQWTGQESAALGERTHEFQNVTQPYSLFSERSAEEKVNIRDSLLVEKSRESLLPTSLSAEDKRNSYASFDGNYGARGSLEIPNLINFDGRDRSSTSESFKMDPELIERVQADEGELYTVVSKVNGASSPVKHHNPPVPPQSAKPSKSVLIPTSQSSREASPYSHLNYTSASSAPPPREGRGRGGGGERKKIPPPKPQRPAHLNNGPDYSEIDEVREGAKQLSNMGSSPQAEPSSVPPSKYDHVPIEGRKLILEAVAPRQSTSDNDMWMSVKWETMAVLLHKRDSELRRSNSSGALEAPDYTNLAEIATESVPIAESPRRHSFSVGERLRFSSHCQQDLNNTRSVNLANTSDDIVPPDADEDKDVYEFLLMLTMSTTMLLR